MVPASGSASAELSARFIDELLRYYSIRDSEGALIRKQVTVADFLLYIERLLTSPEQAFKSFKEYIMRREDVRRAYTQKSSFISITTDNSASQHTVKKTIGQIKDVYQQ